MGFIGDILGGSSKQTTTFAPTPEQQRLMGQQTEVGQFQLEELQRQRALQDQMLADLGLAANTYDQSTAGFTGEPTPEQQALIDEQINAALQQGQSDILAFQTQATNQLRNELAPSLGLMTGDTPILDRGSLIAQESVRQQGQLESSLAGQRAQLSLDYPLQAQDFQARLAQNAFQNRLALAGTSGTLGLGLAGAASPQVGGVLGNQSSVTKGSNPSAGLQAPLGGIGGLMTGIGAIV